MFIAYSHEGTRSRNEDAFDDTLGHAFIMVDAHMDTAAFGKFSEEGVQFARNAVRLFVDELSARPKPEELPSVFSRVDEGLFKLHPYEDSMLGAAAMVVVLSDDGIHGAHVGDCRLMSLAPAGELAVHNEVHQLSNPSERRRVEAAIAGRKNFFITPGAAPRLAVTLKQDLISIEATRTLGDRMGEPGIIHVPDTFFIPEKDIIPGTVFALVTDGGELPAADALQRARSKHGQASPRQVYAEMHLRVRELVREKKYLDNCTAIFFTFR